MASPSTPPDPFLYACISYNTTILTEHTTNASFQASSVVSLILPTISHTTPQKLTYTLHSNFIHYIADSPSEYPSTATSGKLTYLVVADSSLGRRIPFSFLLEIKKLFLKKYPVDSTDFSTLPCYGAASFNNEIKRLTVEYTTSGSGKKDAIQNLQGEVDNVRVIMIQNIDSLLERGDRIGILIDKTNKLGGTAHDFRLRSRGLRRNMWWKNIKLMSLLILVILIVAYISIGSFCGFPGWSKCIAHLI